MGKIHTVFNSMSGKETELILKLLDHHLNTIFQRRTHTPFQATLPGHISYLWKPQHGAYRQQALRISQESLNCISRRGLKQAEVKRKPQGQWGAEGGGGGGGRGHWEGKKQEDRSDSWLAGVVLEKVAAWARQSGAVQLFSSSGIKVRVPWTEKAATAAPAAASAAQAANSSCSRRRRPKEGREEEREEGGTDRWRSRAPRALVLVTWGAQERVSATTTVQGALSRSVTPLRWQSPLSVASSLWWLQVRSWAQPLLSSRSGGAGGGGSSIAKALRPARWTRVGSRARSREPGWRQRAAACRPGRAAARAATAPTGPRWKPRSTSGGTSSTTSTRSGSPSSASCTPITICPRRRLPRPSPSPSARCSRRRLPLCRPRRRPGPVAAATPRAGPPAASGIAATRTPSATCTAAPWTAPPTRWRPATGPAWRNPGCPGPRRSRDSGGEWRVPPPPFRQGVTSPVLGFSLLVYLSPAILDPGTNSILGIGGGRAGACLSFLEWLRFRCV